MTRYRVFISSTIEDLQDARLQVDAELSATEIFDVVRVEKLPAVDEPSRRLCLDEVRLADALVLILGHRYGFVPVANNPDGFSVTHLEYREAKRLGKPIFAFIRDNSSPEERMVEFIREVSDFDEGVVRKKWLLVENLRIEARRALLFWLARRARDSGSSEIQQQLAGEIRRYPELWELQCVIETPSQVSSNLGEWLDEVFRQFVIACERQLLPIPCRRDDPEIRREKPAIRIQARPSVQSGRVLIVIQLVHAPSGASQQSLKTFTHATQLDVRQGPEAARLVGKCCAAVTYLAVDDWNRCIDGLFEAANGAAVTEESRARLLGTAAYVSAFNQGQRSFDVIHRMLELRRLNAPTVSAGIIALTTAQLRFQNARARHALSEAEHLAMRLLVVALNTGEISAAILYNLARDAFHYSPQAALTFYSKLFRSDPSYDERWYFHRDLGLIHYSLGNYEDAARHYDQACHLKQDDSELFRFAGDAYYYQGCWSAALLCYERALQIEPAERYFLDLKIDFAKTKIRGRVERDRRFVTWRKVSHFFSRIGVRFAEAEQNTAAQWLFLLSNKFSDLNFDANKWLALYTNRQGKYQQAILYLNRALAVIPEDPSPRLHLVLNMIFSENGCFTNDSREHAKAAIFHGGPDTRDQFRLQLINTPNREGLCRELNDVLFEEVKREREEWQQRRKEVLRPERFGAAIHFEFRP